MASNASSAKTMGSVNPCCAKWITAYRKLEDKRAALREGVAVLNKQIDLLQLDNANLKKACEEERARLNVAENEKGNELSLRISMEKEIAVLKSEISSTKPEETSRNVDLGKEMTHLQTCISEREMEIDRLKQLLADEILRVDIEKKAAELERKNVAELQKSLNYEKRKADEASNMADAAARKAEDHRVQLETLRNELEKTNLKWEEVNRKLETERQNAIEEKRCFDEKRVQEEECRANNLFTQLEEEKQKVEKLQKEMQEFMTLKSSANTSELDEVKRKLEAEKNIVAKEKKRVAEEKVKVIEQRKIVEASEKRVLEEKCHADQLLKQLQEEKQKVEKLQRELQEALSSQKDNDFSELHELKKKFEEEKEKVAQEQKRVEEEKARAMEQRKIADANKKRGSEENCRADELLRHLEEQKQKVQKLQRELQEVLSSQKTIDSSEFDVLKKTLEEEKKKVSQVQKCFEEEKARTMEQIKIADANKKRGFEEKCRADELLRQLEEEKQKVEKLQRELQEVLSSQKAVVTSEFDELKRNLEEEKKKVSQEKKCVEEEKARVMEQRQMADANKRDSEEKLCADKLLMQLGEEKQKVEKLQREMQEVELSTKTAYSSKLDEVTRNLEAEQKKVARERKRIDLEISRKEEQKKLAEASIKNAMEEKCRADKLFEELVSSREKIKNLESKLNKVNGMLEAERQEVLREKLHADLQKLKSEERGNIAVANETRSMEEKSRGDNLFQELENARQKLQDVEHELNEVKLCRGLGRTSIAAPSSAVNEQAARVYLLQEQLKFEKKRVKHAKEVVKLEKGRNSILQQELQRLKQDFQYLLDHLGMLSDTFGARNGVTNVQKKLGLSQMHFRGDDELRMSSLSSRDASCRFKPNMQLVQAGLRMESTSGMENELDPLQGGSRGDTIPSSALNSNTASFSDEQLLGSQERVAGSLTMSAGLSVENPKQQATALRGSTECCKRKSGEKVCVVGEHSIRSPVKAVTDHAKKRRRILDEFESIKNMHLEGKSIFQEAEKKLLTLQNALLKPMTNEQMEKEILPLPVNKTNLCGNSDWSGKRRKILRKPDVVFQQGHDPKLQKEVGNLFAPSATKTKESSQPLSVLERDRVEHNQDAVMNFEKVINGDYMKLLDLDSAVAEENFRRAMERPVSPIPPEFDLLEFGQKDEAQILSVSISGNGAKHHQHEFQAHNENELFFVLFNDLEDVGSITRIYGATRTCLARCLFFQTDFSVQDVMGALLLEKDLKPREKACVLFSLILLNFSAVSSSKPVNFLIQEQMDSFSAHIHTVFSNPDMRDLFVKICDLRELLVLNEDFILNRKIVSNNVTCKLLYSCGSSVEILKEGEKIVLWLKMASTDLVVAGSIVLASFSKAVGHIGYVCEVSLKILQIGRAEYSSTLAILHSFAHVCGDDYFSISNYSSVLKVVRSVTTFMEGYLTKNANKNLQPGDNTQHWFTPCVRCPFSEGSVSLDDVSSELLEELQRHTVPQNPAGSVHLSNRESLSCILGDVLSSLELIASIMGWDWVCDKIVPKLTKMLESSHQDRVFSTALVVLLGDIGRLGVDARGYDDTGIEEIKRLLLGLLYQTAASKCDTTLPMAIVYGLMGLYPKGHEMFQKGNNFELPPEGSHPSSGSSDIVSKFLSSLSSEQISSLASLVNPDLGVAA